MKTEIKIREDLKDWVLSGEKTATTRLGVKEIPVGPGVIVFNESGTKIPVEITAVKQCPFSGIDKDLATKENHTVESLKAVLEHIYGPINDNQIMTVIEFKMV